ncbi:BrnT family toxin [Deinococcus pimensis]|uniref:BrnT family toxin n=1 Tax=Deinococcus pimensis TaxID=309888 RepID=UPI0004B2825F|nr:BrnT family toxin [Deinococcus pimensis]
MRFDWDHHNVGHIAAHKVEPEEAEEAATDPAGLPFEAHRGPKGQRRFGILGATEFGRVLVVILEPRGERVRVCTARPATKSERTLYETQED